CTAELVQEGYPTLFPAANTVVELLETVEPTPSVVEACRKLKDARYRIALDDFEDRADYAPLIELADIIKVDFRLSGHGQRIELAQRYGTRHKLLAEKVETYEEFDEASAAGYSFFQGFFFCKPKILTARKPRAINAQHLKLLSLLGSSNFDFAEIERL